MQNTACRITKVQYKVVWQLEGLIKGFMFK